MFSKKYDHHDEQKIYQFWLDNKCFEPIPNSDPEKKFIIPIPPPNVTGVLHIGHAMMLAVQDTLVRYHRMKGYETLWVPGTDHAGIATQAVVEKNLQKESWKKKEDLGREAFMKKLWDWVLDSRSTINTQFQHMGSSVDWSREQFTMSEQLCRAVRKAFKKLYDQGKIYQSNYMVNRSIGAQTVVSDMEVEYKEEKATLYYIRYFIEGKWDSIVVATVRPETIFADVAIAINPRDKKYKKWIGKNVLVPIINRPIPIIADERVLMDFGTGALKITPTHSIDDYHIARDHNLPMNLYAVDKQNKFTELAWEFLAWKSVNEFRDNFIQELSEIWNIDHVESYVTKVPYCERTGTKIEPILSTQWFYNVEESSNKVADAFEKNIISIYPERFKKTFLQWLSDIKPRCISRQLRWGHRIPVWKSPDGNSYCFDEDTVLQETNILSLIIFNCIADWRLVNPFSIPDVLEVLQQSCVTPVDKKVYQSYCDMYAIKFSWNKKLMTQIELIRNIFDNCDTGNATTCQKAAECLVDVLDTASNIESLWEKYRFCFYEGGLKLDLVQDEDVLDTRFSSALRPCTIMWWPDDTMDMRHYYPNTILETWYDIIFFRVIRMLIMGIEQTDILPFNQVYLHGLVRDEQGRKMSKSLWNVIDPLVLTEQYGSDALRASLLLWSTPWNDIKFSDQKVEYMRRFLNKLWNASRFVVTKYFDENDLPSIDYHTLEQDIEKNLENLNPFDIWILWKLQEKYVKVQNYIDKYMLWEALQEIIDITWWDLCDRYIEITKKQSSSYSPKILLYTLSSIYKLLHPFVPHVTEMLWKHMWFEGILMLSARPQPILIKSKNFRINLLMDIISTRRTLKWQIQQKSHEKIHLMVQANKDILDQIREQESLIKELLNVEIINYYSLALPIEGNYITDIIMDIKLWVQGTDDIIDWRDSLQSLEKQLLDEEQFLQRMRSTIISPEFLSKAPPQVVADRKEKIQEVKNKITQIQLEIQKIKSQH